MEGCLAKMRELLPSLPITERKIALVVLDSPTQAIKMQIDELASLSGVSAASVVRLSKRLGYSGFKELCRSISSIWPSSARTSPMRTCTPTRTWRRSSAPPATPI